MIKIREAFPTRTVLFDIGVAGPIAGFVVLRAGAVLGHGAVRASCPPRTSRAAWRFGEPLLFRVVSWLTFGAIPDGQTLNIHPMVFAAWFGMLATALNLLPFGQLDGGHLTYATLQRHSTIISS